MAHHLIISTANELIRIAPEKIIYISSDGNYSLLYQTNDDVRTLTFQLGELERMIGDQLGSAGNVFIRIGRSLIINRSYIYQIDMRRQRLILSDIDRFSHTVSASKEALRQLKELIEKEV